MTTAIPAVSVELQEESKAARGKAKKKTSPLAELAAMRGKMASENGLFNAAQAAMYLEVSRERIYELMELGILKKYEFLGRIYLSCKQLDERREADIKAGRPRRNLARRLKFALDATVASDLAQFTQEPIADAEKLAKKVKEIIKPAKQK